MESAPDTRESLIEAATGLFAEHGFDAVSLRTITQTAKANVAAVNYHFGSKDGLIEAVLVRQIEPINRERLERLDALEADPAVPGVEAVLRALLEPVFGALSDPGRARLALGLMARIHLEPERAATVMQQHLATVIRRFCAAFQRCVPELDPTTAFWRLHFVVGSSLHILQAQRHRALLASVVGEDDLLARAREQLIAFAVAGVAAPVDDAAGRS